MDIAPNTHFSSFPILEPKSPAFLSSTRERLGFLYGFLAAVIWGGYIAVSQAGVGAGLSAEDLAFLRYAPAGLLLLPWLLRHSPLSLAGIGWFRGIVLTFFIGPPFVFIGASGFHFAPLAHSAVIQLGTVSLMGIILSAVFAREQLGLRRSIGLFIILAGLCVTAGPGLVSGNSDVWKGDLLFALAGTMWAIFTVLQRRWNVCPIAATAVVSVLSAAFYGPAYFVFHGSSNLMQVSPSILVQQVVVLGILSGVVALFTFARAVEILGPGRASLFPATSPAFAIVLGIPVSGTIPTAWQLLGLVVLSLGLMVAMRKASP
ncbi:DMT family transporter [Rhizobium leguminosarum]|uniref:DMT family transporter n=1 Tax=Rhizobium leguminosarum TaxID=384 RepID=UPI003F9EA905